MQRISKALIAATGSVLALTAQTGPSINPDELVRAATDAPKHVSYVGQQQSTRWGTTRAVSSIVRIEHKAPDATRRTFIAPPSLYGQYTITEGAATSDFDVRDSRVITSQNPAAENQVAYNDNIAKLSENYRAVEGPDESVAGRPALTISLINRHTGERTMRLWLDSATHLVLARESYHSDGSLASRMRFDEIRFTADIPQSTFSRSIPAGFQRVAGRRFADPTTDIGSAVKDAGFKPVGPRYLPEGFSLISADVTAVKSIKSLHLLYSDGLRNVSLFENAADAAADFGALKVTTISFEGHDAHYVKDGPTTLLTWREHKLAFALVGDLEINELVEIAKSVIP